MDRTLAIDLLGAPRMEIDGVPLRVDTRKATALLAYLAVTGQAHEREHLAGLLWPDYAQASARASLRRTLSALVGALGGDWIEASRTMVGLRAAGVRIDVARFRALADSDDTAHLLEAVALYRGEFLEGFSLRDAEPFDEWRFFQSQDLRDVQARVLERLADRLHAHGDTGAAIEHARHWLRLDPLREEAHRQLMVLYAAAGQRAAALRQYRECVRTLYRELGVAPLEETTALYQRVKKARALEPIPAPAVRAAEAAKPPPAASAEPPPAASAEPPPAASAEPPPAASAEWPLIGRESEQAALGEVYRATGPDGRFVVVDGPPGIGKTRLAATLASTADEAGAATIAVRCYPGERDLTYAPVAALTRVATRRLGGDTPHYLLAEAARLIPEVGVESSLSTLDQPGARDHFLTSLVDLFTAALAGPSPGVLFVDDLQWADDASLAAFTYLIHRLEGRPVCVVATWRGDAQRSRRLRPLLAHVRRAGQPLVVTPGALSPEEVGTLASTRTASTHLQADGVAERVHAETAGVPLLVVEYLHALVAGGPEADEGGLPIGVREVLLARTASLSEGASEVLAAAATLGSAFDPDLLTAVGGRGMDFAVAALEELIDTGAVVESPTNGGRYDLAHPRLREVVYDDISLARRRLLHGRVADALRERHRTDLAAHAAWIASHAQRAGKEAEAAELYEHAAGHAVALGARQDALEHLRTALALGHPEPMRLHEAVGDLLTREGRYAEALHAYETAAASASREGIARIEHRIALVHVRTAEWGLAAAHLDAAADAGQGAEPGFRARLLADRSLVAHRSGARDDAHAFAAAAVDLAESCGDKAALAQACNVLGMLTRDAGDGEKARELLERSLSLAEGLADPAAQVAALNNLGRLHLGLGAVETALSYAEAALARCRAEGDRHHEAALHSNLADVLHAAGEEDAATDHGRQAAELAATIGGSTPSDPEVWKLVDW